MHVKDIFQFIRVDPVNLSLKAKFLAVLSGSMAILVTAWVSQQLCDASAYPAMAASMGASAVILFILPSSPLAQPWPLVGGQLVSAVIGVACSQAIDNSVWASGCAVGGSILVMLLLRCLHPPGAATALIPVIASNPTQPMDYGFVLMPIGLNVLVMLVMAVIVNRWLLGYDYPVTSYVSQNKKNKPNLLIEPSQVAGISPQDVELALGNMDRFMDVSTGDLSQLLSNAQLQSFKRNQGNITCADIMVNTTVAVEYGTEVEDAWNILCKEQLKALPVIDRAHRVIGIITWNDFVKFIDTEKPERFSDKFKAFIRRTPDIHTGKPESVGHIMSSPALVMSASHHIADLIPLMSNQGHRQIPIVNDENRLIGMVYQANLIAALYNQSHNN